MLDLQPGIGLDEAEEGLLAGGVDQEFEGAEAAILRGLRHADRRRHDLLTQVDGEARTRRHLDNLLIAPLDRAVALAEGHDSALAVAHDLHLDVACTVDQPFGIECAIAEGGLGLHRATLESLGDLGVLAHGPHAAPAAAGNRLDHDPCTGMLGEERFYTGKVSRALGAGQQRRPGLGGMGPSLHLIAKQVELLGSRSHEDQPRFGTGTGKDRILGQEAVAGMNRIAARGLCHGDHAPDVEIGCRALSFQRPGLVDPPDVQRRGVVLRMDAHGGDAEFGGSLGDAYGDFTAIGDQEFFEHGPEYRVKTRRCRNAC